jgi:two-component system chemotaxis response regulator CheB
VSGKAINVVIIDDSKAARQALRVALESDPSIHIAGEASNGKDALASIQNIGPDIITLEVNLFHENGADVVAAIMAKCPLPILIVTESQSSDSELVYQALQAGALDVCAKLPSQRSDSYAAQHRRLLRIVKSLARVPVVHRFARNRRSRGRPGEANRERKRCQAVVMGASTGGPPVLATILGALPPPFAVPVVIAQHLTIGFEVGFAGWLQSVTGHRATLVEQRTALAAGEVYLAPSDRHVVFESATHLRPTRTDTGRPHMPSVDLLFASAARHFGSSAIGVVCSGMSDDGARGAVELKKAGALTIAQAPETCAVSSMPDRAIAAATISVILSPLEIGRTLMGAVRSTAALRPSSR